MATKIIEKAESLQFSTHTPDVKSISDSFDEIAINEASIEDTARILRLGRAVVAAAEDGVAQSFIEARVSPDKVIEERRSAHQVGFGVMLDCERSFKGKPRKHSVAFKPFNSPEDAVKEVRGYLTLKELGVETYDPVGIFPSADKEHYVVVTQKRADLTSLDNDTWVVGRRVVDEATDEISKRNSETVKSIAAELAYIHSNGVFHPDGQIKNYAITPDGKTGIIDTENLTKIEINGHSEGDRAWYDIEKLVKSLIVNTQDQEDATLFGVGMLHGMPLNDTRRCLEELVISPYTNALLEQLDDCDENREQYIQNIYDGVERMFSDKNWPEHFIKN